MNISLCKKFTLKAKKQPLASLSIKNVTSNNKFCDAVKPYFSNKITKSNDFIYIKHKVIEWKIKKSFQNF